MTSVPCACGSVVARRISARSPQPATTGNGVSTEMAFADLTSAGVSLDGSALQIDDVANASYYGNPGFAGAAPPIPPAAQSLVQIKSLSGQEEEMIKVIQKKMTALGYDEVRIDSMGNLLGRIGDGPKRIFP